jgi:hypothetical protein
VKRIIGLGLALTALIALAGCKPSEPPPLAHVGYATLEVSVGFETGGEESLKGSNVQMTWSLIRADGSKVTHADQLNSAESWGARAPQGTWFIKVTDLEGFSKFTLYVSPLRPHDATTKTCRVIQLYASGAPGFKDEESNSKPGGPVSCTIQGVGLKA